MSRTLVAFVTGGRDDETLKILLDKIGLKGKSFVTDDWAGYQRQIPENQLFTGKDLTYPIEQDNSNTRHYLARFHRRSKVTSRSKEMVDISLKLLFWIQKPEIYKKFQNKFLSIFG